MEVIQGFGILLVIFAIYFVPSALAYDRKSPNIGAIFALNLLLGWTFLGWVIALVWALTQKEN